MRSPKFLVLPLLAVAGADADSTSAPSYALVDNFDHTNFFNEFDFFSGADPTNGFVKYATEAVANQSALAGYADNRVYLGVDHRTANTPSGRGSTRVTSKKAYTKGLFIADVAHMPVGCGVWPAFWTFGPNWPHSGEIDMLEGVNSATTNSITLHTSPGCTVSTAGGLASSHLASGNADCSAGSGTMGCSQQTTDQTAYGPGLNAAGGGVYAMEWTSQDISVWFFPRGSAGAKAAASSSPRPSAFGTPVARFSGSGCDIDARFANHNIVFNTALCGDWAGNVWAQDATCAPKAASCQAYVADSASDFTQAYWLINNLRVFQVPGSGSVSAPAKRAFVPKPFIA